MAEFASIVQEYAHNLVASWPPISEEQRERVAVLLTPGVAERSAGQDPD